MFGLKLLEREGSGKDLLLPKLVFGNIQTFFQGSSPKWCACKGTKKQTQKQNFFKKSQPELQKKKITLWNIFCF